MACHHATCTFGTRLPPVRLMPHYVSARTRNGGRDLMGGSMLQRPRPGDLRAITQVTKSRRPGSLVRVITQSAKRWNREEFFAWLESGETNALSRAEIPHVGRLAELAGISPSTISKWRSGKMRPTVATLTAIARVLNVKRRDILLVAGLLDEADLTTVEGQREDEELSAEEREVIAKVNASGLSASQKKIVIADQLAEIRRDREERSRRLDSTIHMLETT